ncbi:hypothetical protein [Azotobacter salinestris]|uniref:hypothetical protein n=1 Tax=Azotobacter salinestris TaxID=69964 RepID=UPI0032DE99BD
MGDERTTDTRRTASGAPRFQIAADRQSATRRVRYIETSHADDGGCRLCQLDSGTLAAAGEPMSQSEREPLDDEAFAEQTLIEAIENQIEADDPPAARATLNKLTLVGYEREEILHLMALVLAHEIAAMLREDRPFDGAWYEQALRALPELPETAG